VKKIVDQVEASPTYTKDTAIFITEDEGGGYYDSGYVQPVDFFGDGTRIPLIVVANPQYLPLRGGISRTNTPTMSRSSSSSSATGAAAGHAPQPRQLPEPGADSIPQWLGASSRCLPRRVMPAGRSPPIP
jgi:hypothetical protein